RDLRERAEGDLDVAMPPSPPRGLERIEQAPRSGRHSRKSRDSGAAGCHASRCRTTPGCSRAASWAGSPFPSSDSLQKRVMEAPPAIANTKELRNETFQVAGSDTCGGIRFGRCAVELGVRCVTPKLTRICERKDVDGRKRRYRSRRRTPTLKQRTRICKMQKSASDRYGRSG